MGGENSYMENKKTIDKRNYGIDLLRMIAMINIINLHINKNMGLLFTLKFHESQFKPIWRLESFSMWSVDCFGLISGIVGYKKYNFLNLIYIWFILLFYSIMISLLIYFIDKNGITKKQIILSLFPLLTKRHWYFNAYFQMYLLLPFIINGIKDLDKRTFKNIIIFFIFFYSFYNIFGIYFGINKNYHFLLNGYSGMWLTILYVIGAYLGKYIFMDNKNQSNLIKIIYIFLYLFSSFISSDIYFKLFETKSKISNNLFINYLSPTMIIQAISLIFIFAKFEFKNKYAKKFISFFTPLIFSVQLIHARLFANKKRIKLLFNLFHNIKYFKNSNIFFVIYGFSIITFFICAFLDYLRLLLFKLLKIRELCLFIKKIFPELIDKIS